MSDKYIGIEYPPEEEPQGPRNPRRTPPPEPPKNDGDWLGWALIAILFAVGAWPIGLILLISKLRDGRKGKNIASNTRSYTQEAAGPRIRRVEHTGAASRTAGEANRHAAAHPDNTIRRAAKNVTKTPNTSGRGARVMETVGLSLMVVFGVGMASELTDLINGWSVDSGDMFAILSFFAAGACLFVSGFRTRGRFKRAARYLAVIGNRDSVPLDELMAVSNKRRKTVEKDLEFMIEKGMLGAGAFIDSSRGVLFRDAEAYQRELVEIGKKMSERAAEENLTPAEVNEGYAGALRAIRAANDQIPDPVFSEKLDRMEYLAGRIFREVEAHPEKQKQASSFFDYYLPTMLRLLTTYIQFEEAGIEGENLRQAKERIESIMDTLLENFEKQLDELYRSEAMDVESDIRVMENMLSRDLSSVEQDFGLGGAAAQRSPFET